MSQINGNQLKNLLWLFLSLFAPYDFFYKMRSWLIQNQIACWFFHPYLCFDGKRCPNIISCFDNGNAQHYENWINCVWTAWNCRMNAMNHFHKGTLLQVYCMKEVHSTLFRNYLPSAKRPYKKPIEAYTRYGCSRFFRSKRGDFQVSPFHIWLKVVNYLLFPTFPLTSLLSHFRCFQRIPF